MKQEKELEYYEEMKNWDFSKFEIETESLTNWDYYDVINKLATKESRILDLGTGGGEKVLQYFPECEKIVGTDFSEEMIKAANKNLIERCDLNRKKFYEHMKLKGSFLTNNIFLLLIHSLLFPFNISKFIPCCFNHSFVSFIIVVSIADI